MRFSETGDPKANSYIVDIVEDVQKLYAKNVLEQIITQSKQFIENNGRLILETENLGTKKSHPLR